MRNMIVIDEIKELSDGGLRYDNEFVKQKMLDAICDLFVAGRPLFAAYSAFKSGNALNDKLMRAAQPSGSFA